MAQPLRDLDTKGKFPKPVQHFARPFHRASHGLLIGDCPFPEFASSLAYDYRVPFELKSRFPIFQSIWPKIRPAPTFCALFLSVFASSGVASLPCEALPLFLDLLDQTPTFDAVLLNVVVPTAFGFMGDCPGVDDLFNGIVKRFPLQQVLPLFSNSPHTPVFLGILKGIVARSHITPELGAGVLSSLADVDHPDAEQIRELLPAAGRIATQPSRAATAARLSSVLDEIEGDCVRGDPVQTVTFMAGQLRRSPFPPGRPFEPHIRFCLRTWCGLDESNHNLHTNETDVLFVLRKIHEIPGQAEPIYRLYQRLAHEQTFTPEKLEQAYQYLQVQFGGVLPGGEPMQPSLAQAVADVDERAELAFEALTSLATAYDGVQMMWQLVCDQPGFDFEAGFLKLPMFARYFLVEGFAYRVASDTGGGRAEREALLNRLKEVNRNVTGVMRAKRDGVQNLNEKMTSVRARIRPPRTPERPRKRPDNSRMPQSTRPPGKG